jgi:hypothetical protein
MSIYIEPKDLQSTYNEAERVATEWYKPFDEYERIAGNKLSKTLAKHMPRVNDGSLSASLLETPMNVLPFMQPGKFTSQKQKKAWLGELANIIWKTKIVPNAKTQASFFDKEQIALYRAIKYGAQPRYNFYVSTESYTGCDWSLPYIKNVKLEPGKFSDEDCDYIYLDIYYTKLQLQKIREQQKDEAKLAKEEGRKADTSWNTKALDTLIDGAMDSKQLEDQNSNEREKQIHSSGIKTTVCFNRGVDAPFYMFSKHLPEGELLREWKNPDPTGALPITMQYCYETLESPVGIGRVELAGPTQNVLDYMTQAHVLATQLGLQPAKKFKGSIDSAKLDTFVNQPDALWIMGSGSDVELMQNTSSVYTQFPSNFGLYKSQLQTLQGRTDGSVSATSGNPTFSKTSRGVAQQEQRTNAQDNYLRNKADSASSRMAEKMMNIHMSKMQGADLLDIAEEDRTRLQTAGFFDDNPMTDAPSLTEIPILYDELRDTFEFKYDPRPEADDEEKNKWLEIIDIVASNPTIIPMIQQSGYDFNIGEAFKRVVAASGADGVDKVLTKMEAEQPGGIDPLTGQPLPAMPGGMPMTQGLQAQMPQQMTAPQPPQGPQLDPDELQATMEMYGIDQPQAMAVMEARQQGFQEDEIVKFLQRDK